MSGEMRAYGSRSKGGDVGEVGGVLEGAPLGCPYPFDDSGLLVEERSSWAKGGSTSKIPKPMPASAKSLRIATLTAANRSFDKISALAITGRTLTRPESRRIAAMSAWGRVGLARRGFVVTGGSRITGSWSGCEKLLVRVREMSGAGGAGTEGGTIWSGSRK